MPTSLLDQIPWVTNMVETIPPAERRTVLEVGPGCGTYGVILRGYVNSPPDRIDAVEIWRPYIERFRLSGIYDSVYVGSVTDQAWQYYEPGHPDEPMTVLASCMAGFDVVLMGDVIEHIEKQTALALLDRIPGRVVICTPTVDVPCSGDGYENPAEAHVSHWVEDDWRRQEKRRPVEVCHQKHDGWLVRLGRLPT